MNGLDLRSLEIFHAVATEGSVSKAAVKLNRVQSNVSTRIKQLEAQLRKPLFLRRSRGLTLTSDGETLLAYSERFLQLSAEASEALGAAEPTGQFRIGAMESTAAARLPGILARYDSLHPAVEIRLETGTAGALLRRLRNYDIEIAFVAEPVSLERLVTRSVFEERLVLVTPRSFPKLTDPKDLNGRTMIAFEAGCAYRRYLEQWLLESGVVPGNTMEVSSYLAILASVSAGTGFAVVPQSVLNVVADSDCFRQHRLPAKFNSIKTLLVWREDYASARLDSLLALLPGA